MQHVWDVAEVSIDAARGWGRTSRSRAAAAATTRWATYSGDQASPRCMPRGQCAVPVPSDHTHPRPPLPHSSRCKSCARLTILGPDRRPVRAHVLCGHLGGHESRADHCDPFGCYKMSNSPQSTWGHALSLCLCVSFSLCLSLFVFALSLFFSVFLCLSLSLSVSVTHTHTHTHK